MCASFCVDGRASCVVQTTGSESSSSVSKLARSAMHQPNTSRVAGHWNDQPSASMKESSWLRIWDAKAQIFFYVNHEAKLKTWKVLFELTSYRKISFCVICLVEA